MSVSTRERLRLKIIDKLHHQATHHHLVAEVGILYILLPLILVPDRRSGRGHANLCRRVLQVLRRVPGGGDSSCRQWRGLEVQPGVANNGLRNQQRRGEGGGSKIKGALPVGAPGRLKLALTVMNFLANQTAHQS